MPRLDTVRRAHARARSATASQRIPGASAHRTLGAYTKGFDADGRDSHPGSAHCSVHRVEQCSPGPLRGARPFKLNLTRTPQPDISTGRGLRKPRASNSAGAASNGAQVVVFEAHSSAQTATSIRKGRLQLPPDDS